MLTRGLILFCLAVVVTLPASAQSLDDILQRHIQARGGLENLKSVNSIRYFGKISAGGMEVPIIVEQKRPKSMRVVFTQQGAQGIQAFDGKTGWRIPATPDKREPEALDPDTLKATIEGSDFDGPLVDYQNKGNRITLIGRDFIQGKAVYKLQLTVSSGDTSFIYIDADSYLVVREDAKRLVSGMPIEAITDYSDYRRVGNTVIAHSIQTVTRGAAPLEKITIDRVELNPSLDDSIFRMPPQR